MAERVPAGLNATPWSAAEGRKFGLTVGAAFLVLAGVVWWRGREIVALIFAGIGILLVIAGLVIPARLGPVYRAWMAFAHALSRVTTPVFMAVVYWRVLMPTGLLMRALGRNPLVQRGTREGSYWIVRGGERSDLERQF